MTALDELLHREPGSHRKGKTSPHSFRCADDLWTTATARATDEDGVPITYVIEQLLTGYARGDLSLPRVELDFSGSQKKKKSGK